MKVAYLWGVDFTNILKQPSDIDDVYVILPVDEPNFPVLSQSAIRELLGARTIGVPYSEGSIIQALSEINPDVIISMGWRRVLGERVLDAFTDTLFINIHPAILPQYKGYHTEPYVIINGEVEHGITAHRLTKGLDEGGIFHQVRFPISKFSTTASIKKQAYDLMPEFVRELRSLLSEGRLLESAQDASLTKVVAPKRNASDSEINPEKTLSELFNQIRACDSRQYPAFFYVDGQKVFISMWRADDAQREHELEL
ncbi:methionyl-tRNA formyltransferase [Pseudomonas moraviensis]|uniref:phosphoribosylglycinamide formyltransferase 1 n=1 Tax=Pseudomonas moraviensis TaxID=321662 RepID=A0A7Y9VYA4_9PSED|nr:formyltransferase family protein [Pseudomonas moraviensis]NYH10303.1 methionyl-tRNA formyltransferase [Pseudomonas moraviensis]